ncbi:hypothetical protein GDO78_019338 [Eleutherodactylus coqui]|uniref:Uncharacterized protein n=1 Tax=Eleutherodactylus coqui TaxID=57060 RepID=A0A8J6BKX4_ELECQ|nr:hypothetical protein GDO78_019338 [Eleutherodactylus coqui]
MNSQMITTQRSFTQQTGFSSRYRRVHTVSAEDPGDLFRIWLHKQETFCYIMKPYVPHQCRPLLKLFSALRAGINSRLLLCIQHTINTDPAEVVSTSQHYRIL